MRRPLGPGTPQPWPPEWDRWVIKAERTAYQKLLKQAHELSPFSRGETAQRRSIIRPTRTLRIRQGHGLDGSTAISTSPLRAASILTRNHFHELSRANGPKGQGRKCAVTELGDTENKRLTGSWVPPWCERHFHRVSRANGPK